MELFIISGYAATCIALFTVLRIPLNKWTVPTASIGGVVLTFALIQLLNYYHPYSGMSQQYLTITPVTADGQTTDFELAIEDRIVVAWFPQNSLLRLKHGDEAEVTFDSIPGKVFTGLVRTVTPVSDEDQDWVQEAALNATAMGDQPRIPILIDITDRRYAWYVSQIPNGSRAQTAVYGRKLKDLAVVRKTLLRMSAWMSYLSPIS